MANPCFVCRANTSTRPWTAFTKDAAWLEHLWSQTAWLLAHPNANVLLRTLPCVGCHSLYNDLMHCKHLGTDMRLFGSILFLLTHSVLGHQMLPGTPEQNMEQVFSEIKEEYKESSTHYTHIFVCVYVTVYIDSTAPNIYMYMEM